MGCFADSRVRGSPGQAGRVWWIMSERMVDNEPAAASQCADRFRAHVRQAAAQIRGRRRRGAQSRFGDEHPGDRAGGARHHDHAGVRPHEDVARAIVPLDNRVGEPVDVRGQWPRRCARRAGGHGRRQHPLRRFADRDRRRPGAPARPADRNDVAAAAASFATSPRRGCCMAPTGWRRCFSPWASRQRAGFSSISTVPS